VTAHEPGLTSGAEDALRSARIPPSKLGPRRSAHLTDMQRNLYLWTLRAFATSGRPAFEQVRNEAEALGVDLVDALSTLAREDLVHLGADGEIAVAYPFSGRPTQHRVRFPTGHEVAAMCAIDALGIAPMFGQAVEISSGDALTGEEIRSCVSPDGDLEWSPDSAVVVSGFAGEGVSCSSCCPVLNFFASASNAARWLREHAHVQGIVISMTDAAAAGRAVFGDVLSA
jgi:Alkylmercury lyase